MSEVTTAAYELLTVLVVGVAIVIVLGISYTNLATNKAQLTAANVPTGILANYTTNAGAVANTAGTNGNYVYYILFMALILGVIMGVLIKSAKKNG